MSITEIKQALGGWELRLRPDTPREVLDALSFFGHIAIVPGQIDPVQYGDNLLTTARYVGVYRGKDSQDTYTLKGSGLAFWLGDEDDKGDVFETAVTLTAASFATAVAALLPAGGSITAGTINAIAGTYTGKHQWETPRKAITYVTDTFGGEWRVNGNGTLDAGTVASLYNTSPAALLTPRGHGADLLRKALEGQLAMGVDVEDVTTRVVLLAEGSGDSIATGDADAPATPFKDLHGNSVKMTRLVSESGTESANATARAQLQLNRFVNARRSVQLSSSDYDVKGTFNVGDYLYVYDPANGFYDTNIEIPWEGDRVNPMALRCVELTWPVQTGWTVGFRDINGVWIDLSRWYIGEGGATTIVVGELARGLSSVGGEAIGVRPNLPEAGADFTIPDSPAFGTFSAGNYQGSDGQWTKAAILATWTQPLNQDASTITDGDHYELRYRVNTYIGYAVRWGGLASYRWGSLSGNKWGAPITSPVESGEWHTIFVPWGQTQFLIQELTPGVEYEFQIRAVDTATHQGPFSSSLFYVAEGDIFAPSTPAAPTVASNPVSIQVVHTLAKAGGGAFSLEPDLAYLSVHVDTLSGFLPTDANRVGRLIANGGMIAAQIPAVGTFTIPDTNAIWVKVVAVDREGNASPPSVGVQATVALIDDAHISDLSVSKVTAGTITAGWILAGSIKTSETGARVEIDGDGIRSYNNLGAQTLDVDADTGFVDIVGRFKAETAVGSIIKIDPVGGGDDPFIYLEASNSAANRGHLAQFGTGSVDTTELASKSLATDNVDGGRVWLTKTSASVYVAPEGSTQQSGVGVTVNDVSVRGLSQVQLTADNAAGTGGRGKVLVILGGAVLSHTPNGGVECFVGVGYPSTDRFDGHGKMSNGFGASDGIFAASGIGIGAGFGAINITYGPTMTSNVNPIYSIQGASPNFSHCISAASLTGYTVAWSDALAHNLWTWVTRT